MATSSNTNYENLIFDPFNSNSILLNSLSDPDFNFFNEQKLNINTSYFLPSEAKNFLQTSTINTFSVLHLNIRSMSKNFENLKQLLVTINYTFKIICLTETWCQTQHLKTNSLYHLPEYTIIHQNRNSFHKGGGVCMFLHNSIIHKIRPDLSINDSDTESLSVEIINKSSKNIIVNVVYRPPGGAIKPFKKFLKDIIIKNKKTSKSLYIVGDLNLNALDYECNSKVKNFFNLIFQQGLIPVINKPTRITKKSATAIDHIMTNTFVDADITTGIIKTDISDHFPIFLISKTQGINIYPQKSSILKRHINKNSINDFNNLLHEENWNDIFSINNANDSYDLFLKYFLKHYEIAFPKIEIKIKTKNLLSPWITKGLLKSSTRKQII